MSLNMFPNVGNPSFTEDLSYDKVQPRGPGEGEGPYGSYNEEDGKGVTGPLEVGRNRSLSLNDMDHPPKYATVTSELFPPDLVQEILDFALRRAYRIMNPVLADAIDDGQTLVLFRRQSLEKADDLLEMAIYQEIMERGDTGYDLRTLTPSGVVEFLDHFMSQNKGRVARLEEALLEAFGIYWESRNQIA